MYNSTLADIAGKGSDIKNLPAFGSECSSIDSDNPYGLDSLDWPGNSSTMKASKQ